MQVSLRYRRARHEEPAELESFERADREGPALCDRPQRHSDRGELQPARNWLQSQL